MNERAKRELHPTAVAQISARFEKWPNEGLLLFAELKKAKILTLKKILNHETQRTDRQRRRQSKPLGLSVSRFLTS